MLQEATTGSADVLGELGFDSKHAEFVKNVSLRLVSAWKVTDWYFDDSLKLDHHRTLHTPLRSNDGYGLSILNVHANSQLYGIEQAQFFAKALRDVYRDAVRSPVDWRFALVGDWNLEPFDDVFQNLHDFHADRAFTWARKMAKESNAVPSLYNPMWALLGLPTPPHGTYYYDGNVRGPWRVFDHALIDARLSTTHPSCEILAFAGGMPLTTSSGRPDKKGASDHLPVLTKVLLDEWG